MCFVILRHLSQADAHLGVRHLLHTLAERLAGKRDMGRRRPLLEPGLRKLRAKGDRALKSSVRELFQVF